MNAKSNLHVLKFGGSTLGRPHATREALARVQATAETGRVVVVVSALGDTTDRLLAAADHAARGERAAAAAHTEAIGALAGEIANVDGNPVLDRAAIDALLAPLSALLEGVHLVRECSPRTRDVVLSYGERISSTIVAALLSARGIESAPIDARHIVVSDHTHGDARVDVPATQAMVREAAARWPRVPVVTGFLARTRDGRDTTLGRNGSDYTATLIAQALGATEVQIWTDVPGVLTADPEIVPDARPIARLSYMEAIELARFGARMFHPRTMVPLIESQVPLRIRHMLDPSAPGTLVDSVGADDAGRATSLASLDGQALIHLEVRGQELSRGLASRFQSTFEELGIQVWLGTLSAFGTSVSAVTPESEADRAIEGLQDSFRLELSDGTLDRISVQRPVSLVTLVAEAMGRTPGVLGKLTSALGSIGVNVLAMGQSASERSISCVVAAADAPRAVQTVHAAFHWAHQEVDVFLLGVGTVGRELLAQIEQQQDFLRENHDVHVRLVGAANSKGYVYDAGGLDPKTASTRLADSPDGRPNDIPFGALARHPLPVVVDCTAEDGMEGIYRAAFGHGVHVVAANKKPLTLPVPEYRGLLDAARRGHRAYRYETTVGASLPVIETLRDLVRTGDEVRLVEGSFSGTLGYITDELSKGGDLAETVRKAQEQGFTEPKPQDDLSGLDAARKALILAREIGLELDMGDVALTPLVPARIIEVDALDAFYAALDGYGPEMATAVASARERGEVLRYLARIDPSARDRGEPVMTVGPVTVASDNPAAHLRHAQSFVAFYTLRYRDFPLVVQGAGAGGAVTAAGVLTDILRVAGSLRES